MILDLSYKVEIWPFYQQKTKVRISLMDFYQKTFDFYKKNNKKIFYYKIEPYVLLAIDKKHPVSFDSSVY